MEWGMGLENLANKADIKATSDTLRDRSFQTPEEGFPFLTKGNIKITRH